MARDEEQPLIGSWIWGKMAGYKSARSGVFGKAGQGGFRILGGEGLGLSGILGETGFFD